LNLGTQQENTFDPHYQTAAAVKQECGHKHNGAGGYWLPLSLTDYGVSTKAGPATNVNGGYREQQANPRVNIIHDSRPQIRQNCNEQRARSPSAQLPTFNGNRKWEPFLLQFNNIANDQDWNDQKKLRKLITCLRDEALETFEALSPEEQMSFVTANEKMTNIYGQSDPPSFIRKQLLSLRQAPDEDLLKFRSRIMPLVTRAYKGTTTSMREEMAVDALFRGCSDRDAACSVALLSPSTLDEAVKLLRAAISNKAAIMGSEVQARSVNALNHKDINDTSTKRVQAELDIPNQTRSCYQCGSTDHSTTSCTEVICLYCHQKGHYRYACPSEQSYDRSPHRYKYDDHPRHGRSCDTSRDSSQSRYESRESSYSSEEAARAPFSGRR